MHILVSTARHAGLRSIASGSRQSFVSGLHASNVESAGSIGSPAACHVGQPLT